MCGVVPNVLEWLALDHSWDQECNEPYNTGHSGDLQKKTKDAMARSLSRYPIYQLKS